MTRARLLMFLRVLRALGASKTAYALLALYGVVCGMLWLVSHGIIAPDGSIDLRVWINGHIVDFPKFQVWWFGGGVGALPLGFGLYARAVAKGPLFSVIQAVAPEVAVAVQAIAETAPEDRPEPVVVHPAAAGLGAAAAAVAGLFPAGGER